MGYWADLPFRLRWEPLEGFRQRSKSWERDKQKRQRNMKVVGLSKIRNGAAIGDEEEGESGSSYVGG